jgi:hypothetical protein
LPYSFRLIQKMKKSYPFIIYSYIANENYIRIKKDLKAKIKELKYRHLWSVLCEVNSIITEVSLYFNIGANYDRLNYLHYFIDRCF